MLVREKELYDQLWVVPAHVRACVRVQAHSCARAYVARVRAGGRGRGGEAGGEGE